MNTKTAAANSLYIILFSQLASVSATILAGNIPSFRWSILALMVSGGIGGDRGPYPESQDRRSGCRALVHCLDGRHHCHKPV